MWISMKESIFKDLLKISIQQRFGNIITVDTCGRDCIIIRDFDRIHIFKRERTLRGATPNDTWHMHALPFFEVFGKRLGIFPFSQIIYFALNGFRQFFDQSRHIDSFSNRLVALKPSAKTTKRGKIHINQLVNEWTLDLDNDISKLFRLRCIDPQAGAVDLSE